MAPVNGVPPPHAYVTILIGCLFCEQVTKAMSLFTPNATDVVSDIEKMVEVISKLSSLRGLAKELPNIQQGLQFVTRILAFVQKATKNMPVSPQQ